MASAHVNDDRYSYCSEPSTSGCSTQPTASRKRNIHEVDCGGSSDGDEDAASAAAAAAAAEENVFEVLARNRRYETYNRLFRDKENITIAYCGLNTRETIMIHRLQRMFDVTVGKTWNDDVTHLVVHTVYDNVYKQRSKMYMHAITSHCFIVSCNWVKECLISGYLVPEFEYIVSNKSGNPSPYTSWRVGRGIIDSPMEWASESIVYFHGFDESDEKYLNAVTWSQKVGFMIADDVQELDDERFRLRIAITSKMTEENQVSETEMMSWLLQYKVITVHLDWLLKCFYEYKLCCIDQVFLASDYDETMVEYADMTGYVSFY